MVGYSKSRTFTKRRSAGKVLLSWLILLVMVMLTPMSLFAADQQAQFGVGSIPLQQVRDDLESGTLLEEEDFFEAIAEEIRQEAEAISTEGRSVVALSGVEHRISTPEELNRFLAGDLGNNNDTFILVNDITALLANGGGAPTTVVGRNVAGVSLPHYHPGRPMELDSLNQRTVPFTGVFKGCEEFMRVHGRAPEIRELRLRPRMISEEGQGPVSRDAWSPQTPDLAGHGLPADLTHANRRNDFNDVGFIRVLGHGARIENVSFINARLYDGDSVNASSGLTPHGTTSTAIARGGGTNLASTVQNAQRAGGAGDWANTDDLGLGNWPTHRGLVAGRVAANAMVTINGVNIGNPISETNPAVRGEGYGANNISASRWRGLWNSRQGGMIGRIDTGSIVNISNSDVSVRLFNQALGANNQRGGLVGSNYGAALNVTDVNLNVQLTESHWGGVHGRNTLHAGGIVGYNRGQLNVSTWDNGNNLIHVETHRGGPSSSQMGMEVGMPQGNFHTAENHSITASGSATSRGSYGHFVNVGRGVGFSTGPISISNTSLQGPIAGLGNVGGVVGESRSSLTLSNLKVSGIIGGTHTAIASGNRNGEPNRPVNAGGVVGASIGPVVADNVHVGLNLTGHPVGGDIFGGRNGNSPNSLDTIGVGGFIGSGNSAMITNSSFVGTGTLQMNGNVGGFIGRATGVVLVEGSHTGADVRMSTGGTDNRQRPNGGGGIIGRVTASGSVYMTNVTNNMPVERNRGDVGGIVGRIQGRTLNFTGVTNHGVVRQLSGGGAGTAGLINDWRNAGGLVGDANNTDIRMIDSGNHAPITAHARRRATGGLIGRATGGARTVHLENVENTYDVTRTMRGRGHVGGLIGWVHGTTTVIDATNTGNVLTTGATGSNDRVNTMGGLIGRADRGLTITNSRNEGHVVNNQNRTLRGLGGLVGYARGGTVIIDSENSGDIASSVATAARQTRGDANIGGIIGRSDMRGATRGGRQTILLNVENKGNVGMATHPVSGEALANNLVNSSGGIIGRSVHRAGNSYNFTNVSNEGHVRGRNYTGGIIGFSNSLNVTIAQSANYGLVENLWAGGARGHGGGFIGRAARNTLTIHQSYNTGDVQNIGTTGNLGGNSAARLRRASHGGFIGLISSGQVNITESFNAGAIRGVERNTGGFVGISRGTGRLTISNGFNIGDVTSQLLGSGTGAHVARRERAGNGILGFRDRGPVVIQSVYNAGFVQGRPIYGSPAINPATVRPDRAIGTYISFFNAYYDNTIHAGVPQCVLRGTIGGVPTDIMTRGILPGFTSALWLNGTIDEEGTRLRNTYPYLAWQTGGELQEPFFYRIREIPDNLRAVMDLDGIGQRGTRFTIEERDVNHVRFFMPYSQEGDAPAPGRGVADHFGTITEPLADRTFTRNGLLSAGIVSENYVVGFDIRDRTGVAVIGVDGIDYAIDPQTAEHISWATFEVDGQSVVAPAGILIVRWTRNILYPYHLEETDPRYVEVAALGYGDASRWVAVEDYLDNEEGLVRIPMDRVDIPYVEVRIATEVITGSGDNEVVNSIRALNSHLRHQRPPAAIGGLETALGDGGGTVTSNRRFHLDSVQWRDVLHAGAPNFSQKEHVVRFGSFFLEDSTRPPGPNNRHIIYVYLDDLRVRNPNQMHLNVRWYEEDDSDTDNETSSGSTPIWHSTGAGLNTTNPTRHTVEWTTRQVIDGVTPDAAITSARTGRNDAGRHELNNLLYTTELRVGAPGFRTSDWERVEDLLEYYEEGAREGERRQDFYIYLERLITVQFTIVEYVFDGLNDEGEPIYRREEVLHPILRSDDEEVVISGNTAIGIDGESVHIGADGFIGTTHTISWIEDIVENANSSVSDLNAITVNAVAPITIVLQRPSEYHVILESATPQLGVVTPGFVSVGIGETMNQANVPEIVTEPQEAFRFWDSTVGFPGQTWATTEDIRELPITVPFTRFRAHFESIPQDLIVASVPEDAKVVGKTAIIGDETPVPANTHRVMSGTDVTLYAGNADADNFIFLGWWRGATAPAVGSNVSELTGVHRDVTREFIKPATTTNYFALWGNDEGYIGIPNEPPFTVTFHLYTDRDGILNVFGEAAEVGEYGVYAIQIPVIPGEDRQEWPEQELLEEVLAIGNIYGVSDAPGHAFWGWFTGETLTASTRMRGDLRRPALGDACQLGMLLIAIENADTDATVEAIFEDADGGNLDLFAVWSLWGDVNDDDEVNLSDVELLRQYVYYSHFPGVYIILNLRAANVIVDGSVNLSDRELLRQYVYYGHFPGVNIVLGRAPAVQP